MTGIDLETEPNCIQFQYSIVMSIFYLIAGTTWVILWARAHEHTFKIHMVIGAIAVAGAMANTLLFVNMASLNSSGQLSKFTILAFSSQLLLLDF